MWSLKYSDSTYGFDHVRVSSVQIEGRTYRVEDTPNPRSDGISFGQDFADPGDVKLTLLLNFQHVRNVGVQSEMLREAAFSFLNAWDAAKARIEPWEIAEFTVPRIGMFEGRPRRAEWDWSTFGLGYLVGAATFIRSTNDVYEVPDGGGDGWSQVDVSITAAATKSGWVFPLVFPLQNLEPVSKSTWFEVAGTAEAWPVISIMGPIQSGAELEVPGSFNVRLNRELAYDEVAVIDSRPGRRLCTVNDVPVNVLAPSSSKLSGLSLSPGPHQVSLRGTSAQGTASARVRWRNTKAGI